MYSACMKTLFVITILLISQSTFASDYDRTCLNRFRDATLSLIDSSKALNDQSSNPAQFVAEFTKTEAVLDATRLVCAFEPVEIKNCVRLYHNQYIKMMNNINVVEIARGNQTHVQIGLVEIEMPFIDLRCQ